VTLRIRQVRHQFWSDSTVAKWADEVRLFYIGLWCCADDDGFLEWDMDGVAADLYRYRSSNKRLKDAERWAGIIIRARRMVILDCGLHARIPTLPIHQVVNGRKNYSIRDEHLRQCSVQAVAGRGRPGPAAAAGMVEVEVREGRVEVGGPPPVLDGTGGPPTTTGHGPGTEGWHTLGDTLRAAAIAGPRRRRHTAHSDDERGD
jgi:hypothetical protein